MAYNISCVQGATDPGVMAQCANTATGGTMFGGFVLAFFFVIAGGLKLLGYAFEECVAAASFACFFLSLILWYGEYVSGLFPLGFLAVLAMSAIYIYVVR